MDATGPAQPHQGLQWLQHHAQLVLKGMGQHFQRFAWRMPSMPPDIPLKFNWQQHDGSRQQHFAISSISGSEYTARGSKQQGGMGMPAPAGHAARHNSKNSSREELGRATWTLLHTLAAQFPAQPTRQQQQDVRTLIDSLTRIYPCGECAAHFREIVRRDPPVVSSGGELQQWLCRVHNVVNRSLGKPAFNCSLAASRWQPLDCGDDEEGFEGSGGARGGCDLTVGAISGSRGKRR